MRNPSKVANLTQVALNDAHAANFKSFQQPVRQAAQTKESCGSDSTIDKELEPIKVFETQSGLARLLIYIYLRGRTNVSNVIDIANIHEHAVYPSIKKATGLGLITSDFDPDSPHRARRLTSQTGGSISRGDWMKSTMHSQVNNREP